MGNFASGTNIKGSQTGLLEIVNDEEDFETKFKENQLDYVFTSDKIVLNLLRGDPGKRYNTLQLWRDAVNDQHRLIWMFTFRQAIIVADAMENLDNRIGRDTHQRDRLIVIKASREGCASHSTTFMQLPEETDDFELRRELLGETHPQENTDNQILVIW